MPSRSRSSRWSGAGQGRRGTPGRSPGNEQVSQPVGSGIELVVTQRNLLKDQGVASGRRWTCASNNAGKVAGHLAAVVVPIEEEPLSSGPRTQCGRSADRDRPQQPPRERPGAGPSLNGASLEQIAAIFDDSCNAIRGAVRGALFAQAQGKIELGGLGVSGSSLATMPGSSRQPQGYSGRPTSPGKADARLRERTGLSISTSRSKGSS